MVRSRLSQALRAACFLTASVPLLTLSGCKGSSGGVAASGLPELVRENTYCAMKDLPGARRQTVFVIDGPELVKSELTEFKVNNPGVLDTVNAYLDDANENALAPRERVRLLVVGNSVGDGHVIFEGCMPRLSGKEIASLKQKNGGIANMTNYLTASGTDVDIDKARERFKALIRGAVFHAAADQTGPGDVNSLAALVHAMASIGDEGTATRIVLIAPKALKSIDGFDDVSAARKAGFATAAKSGDFLRLADVVAPFAPGSEVKKQYAQALLLGSGARLTGWTEAAPSQFEAVPVSLSTYAGDFTLAGQPVGQVQVQLGHDEDGNLVNSWIVAGSEQKRATPLFGLLQCDDSDSCTLKGEQRGFAQAWGLHPGGDPQFAEDMPFSGLRQVRLSTSGNKLNGEISDPQAMVALAGHAAANAYSFTAQQIRR